MKEDWEASIVLTYGSSHFMSVIPRKIADRLSIGKRVEPNYETLVTMDIEEEEAKGAEERWKIRFPKRKSQKERKLKAKSSDTSDCDDPVKVANAEDQTLHIFCDLSSEVLAESVKPDKDGKKNTTASQQEEIAVGSKHEPLVTSHSRKKIKQPSMFNFFKPQADTNQFNHNKSTGAIDVKEDSLIREDEVIDGDKSEEIIDRESKVPVNNKIPTENKKRKRDDECKAVKRNLLQKGANRINEFLPEWIDNGFGG